MPFARSFLKFWLSLWMTVCQLLYDDVIALSLYPYPLSKTIQEGKMERERTVEKKWHSSTLRFVSISDEVSWVKQKRLYY